MIDYCIFVQARMSSSRTPGKVLKEISGKPMLLRQLERLKNSNENIPIICVTSIDKKDDAIEQLCNKYNFDCFRGSLDNVLDRYISASDSYNIKNIIRIGGDDPLVDADQVSDLISSHKQNNHDFIFTSHRNGKPYGCAAELISVKSLKEIPSKTQDALYLEHIIPWFHHNKDKYKTMALISTPEFQRPDYYFTVDYPEDLELVRQIFNNLLHLGEFFNFEQLINYCDNHQEIMNINKNLHNGFDF